jgi:LacI family transcriptional regulator
VFLDNREASTLAVAHLAEHGHTRIAAVFGPRSACTSVERLAGYRSALRSRGIAAERGAVARGDYSMRGGHRAMLALLDRPSPPTAVFVTNYYMTLGAVIALNERAVRVPRDLSLVGFDSMELTQVVKPRLTAVVQPLEAIAETAAALLLRRMGGDREGYPQTLRLHAELRLLESVGPPRPPRRYRQPLRASRM